MSLGDMYKKVGAAGGGAFNDARTRMMQEKQAHDHQMEMQSADMVKREISRRRLEYQKVQTNTQRVRRELLRLKTGQKNTQTLSLIRSMETQLRTLESEGRTIDSDIRGKTLEVQRHGGMSF